MIGITKTIEAGGGSITARELTVMEIRNWLRQQSGIDSKPFDMVDELLFSDHQVTVNDLLMMSDASAEVIYSLPPSEVLLLISACREVNPVFFQLRHRLTALASVPVA